MIEPGGPSEDVNYFPHSNLVARRSTVIAECADQSTNVNYIFTDHHKRVRHKKRNERKPNLSK